VTSTPLTTIQAKVSPPPPIETTVSSLTATKICIASIAIIVNMKSQKK
jgi:hypothetical protein